MASDSNIVKASPLTQLAERFHVDPSAVATLLRQTVMRSGTDVEMVAFAIVANQYGLNPFTKELYAFPAKGGGIVPVVGIDGWARIVNNQPGFDGAEFREAWSQDGKTPVSVMCSIYHKERQHPTTVTEYYAECCRPTEPWKQMPMRMLRHKAFIQCARIAFGLGGLYDEDEGADIVRRVESTTITMPQRLPAKQAPEEPVSQAEPQAESTPAPTAADEVQHISESQRRRLFKIAADAGKSVEQLRAYLSETFGITSSRAIPVNIYDSICQWAEAME